LTSGMTGPDSTREAVLLFAHGSRDPAWAEPFERLRALVAAQGAMVELAYLERMTPDLATAAGTLAARGCTAAVVVPVFLGQGSHVREDLPLLVAAASREHPALALRLAPPIGDNEDVLRAIAAACAAARTMT
jgi:sirohydrochlorin cobaltochelatase